MKDSFQSLIEEMLKSSRDIFFDRSTKLSNKLIDSLLNSSSNVRSRNISNKILQLKQIKLKQLILISWS